MPRLFRIRFIRGTKAQIMADGLAPGEPALAIDENRIYVGTATSPVGVALEDELASHAESTRTHGVGSGYYLARTSRADQLPDWADIQNKPTAFTPSAHASSHRPGGSDALPTAAPSGGLGTANQEGTSTAFARADHVHLAFDSLSPANVGTTASPGTATVAARRDHVHALADGVVTTAKLADGAVTTAKIADGAVTDAKVSGRLSLSKLPTSSTSNRVLGVTTANADPAYVEVGTSMIADSAVTSAKIADGAVTDAKIGNRTISDTNAPTGDTAQLTTLLSWLAYMIKATTGAANWRTAPTITVNALASHKSRHALGGADPLTPADIGAVAKSGDTLTGILVAQNNTQYTTPQVRNIIISTLDPSGGGNGDIWLKYTA